MKAEDAAEKLKVKAVDAKDTVIDVKDNITDKLTELDRMLEDTVT